MYCLFPCFICARVSLIVFLARSCLCLSLYYYFFFVVFFRQFPFSRWNDTFQILWHGYKVSLSFTVSMKNVHTHIYIYIHVYVIVWVCDTINIRTSIDIVLKFHFCCTRTTRIIAIWNSLSKWTHIRKAHITHARVYFYNTRRYKETADILENCNNLCGFNCVINFKDFSMLCETIEWMDLIESKRTESKYTQV